MLSRGRTRVCRYSSRYNESAALFAGPATDGICEPHSLCGARLRCGGCYVVSVLASASRIPRCAALAAALRCARLQHPLKCTGNRSQCSPVLAEGEQVRGYPQSLMGAGPDPASWLQQCGDEQALRRPGSRK